MSSKVELPENSRIVQPKYLESYSTRKDLLRRLSNLCTVLRDDDVSESPEWPGLAATCEVVIELVQHSDKEVRLHAILACVEILSIYAPNIPWEETQVLDIFRQINRQLSNMRNLGTSLDKYVSILEHAAHVRIGCILVDMASDDFPDALDVLVEFITTLLSSVTHEHSSDVHGLVKTSIVNCLEEYHSGIAIPVPILDELLQALAGGPTTMILAPTAGPKRSRKGLPQVKVTNATYVVAAGVIRSLHNKLASPISELLNGLLHQEPLWLEQSNLTNVHGIIYELHRVAPQILTTVLGTVANGLRTEDADTRFQVTDMLGKLWETGDWAEKFDSCFRDWLSRHKDVEVKIRSCVLQHALKMESLDAIHTITQMTKSDVSLEVRTAGIRGICNLAYKQTVPPALLQAVGGRLNAKQKQERLDAVAGLSHIFAKQFFVKEIKTNPMLALSTMLDGEDESYGWIPAQIVQCIGYADMRLQVLEAFDESLVSPRHSVQSQAAAWTIVLNQLKGSTWLPNLLGQRADLQRALCLYLDARSEIRKRSSGSEERLAAEAKAEEHLERMAKYMGLGDDALAGLHQARDKHVFRILTAISTSAHSKNARKRALDELPKRTTGPISNTLVELVKMCAMGNSLNVETIEACADMAKEAFDETNFSICTALVETIHTMVSTFPNMGNKCWESLVDLLSDIRSAPMSVKKQTEELVTLITSILAKIPLKKSNDSDLSSLQNILQSICTKDGTPNQVRNSVRSLFQMNDSESLEGLLDSLTSASKLRMPGDDKGSHKLITVFSALSAIADCSPATMASSQRCQRAVTFALESVVLGRGGNDDSDSDSEEENTKSPARRRNTRKHSTPSTNVEGILEDPSLSPTCRQLCSAVDFLVSYIRSVLLQKTKMLKAKKSVDGLKLPPKASVKTLLDTLSGIITDEGLAPSQRDRKKCGTRQDRAAMRLCAGISILRLGDARLGPVKDLITPPVWHALGEFMLDDEKSVQSNAMAELANLLEGKGVYGFEKSGMAPMPPALCFLALTSLCEGHEMRPAEDGGRSIQSASSQCITKLRQVTEDLRTKYSAMGDEYEKKFETIHKMKFMPEYMVPYALHLLTLRRETPIEDGGQDDEDFESDDEEGSIAGSLDVGPRERTLRRRLKFLFEPLVHTLGDKADNISFLLAMTDLLSKNYCPVDSSPLSRRVSAASRFSNGSTKTISEVMKVGDDPQTIKRNRMLQSKLTRVCAVAREALLSLVKRDVNLNSYPGLIQFPNFLFVRKSGKVAKPVAARPTVAVKKRKSPGDLNRSKSKSPRVRFSPEVTKKSLPKRKSVPFQSPSQSDDGSVGVLSPIAKSKSPMGSTPGRSRRSADTESAGGTPPAMLQTVPSTAADSPDGSSKKFSFSQDSDATSRVSSSRRKSPRHSKPTQSQSQSTNGDVVPSSKSTSQSSDLSLSVETKKTTPVKKRKSAPKETGNKRRRGISSVMSPSMPKTISVPSTSSKSAKSRGRTTRSKGKAKAVDEFDLDFVDVSGPENVPNKVITKKRGSGKGNVVRVATRGRSKRRNT